MPTLEATRQPAAPAHAAGPGPVAARAPAWEPRLEKHRGELTGYCRRVLGTGFEAEDAVQETLVRAWRNIDRFEGRATLRSWLYRIATNVCADMMRRPQRRARPMDLGPVTYDDRAPGVARTPGPGLAGAAGTTATATVDDPADVAASRETLVLALVALRRLPPRQRAVLVLRDVLRWRADEVAELLGSTVASVNSALQRARSGLAAAPNEDAAGSLDPDRHCDLAACIDSFGQVDVDSLVSLLQAEAKGV
jgi:RNA polymerase sigma-70 factor, ECF subfamily